MAIKKKEPVNYCKFTLDLDTPIDELKDPFQKYLRHITFGKIQDIKEESHFLINSNNALILSKYVALLKYKTLEYKVTFSYGKMHYEIL